MNLLLDTNILWWTFYEPDKLRPSAKKMLEEADASFFYSSLSLAELIIKRQTGKIYFDEEELLASLETSGFKEVALRSRHAARTAKLPLLYKDPFDRLIIAQAMEENMTLMSSDALFSKYYAAVIQV